MPDTSTALERVEAADLAERKRLNRMLMQVDVMAHSSLLRQDLRKDGNARAAAITLDQLGVPVTINNMNACYVVNGAVAMMTWLWCSIAAAIGGHEIWLDEASDAERGIAHLKRADTGTVRTVVFTIEDAQRAGLTTGPNKHNYEKYTTDMLGWKALIRVVKRYAPEVMAGLAAAGATPGPVFAAPGNQYPIADPDDEIVDGEIVEPEGDDPAPAAATDEDQDAEELAAFIRWKRAGKPRDENGFIVDVPAGAETDESGGEVDNAGAAVVGASTAPPSSGPVIDQIKAMAKAKGVTHADLLRKAQELAAARDLPAPGALSQLDEQTESDLADWLGELGGTA